MRRPVISILLAVMISGCGLLGRTGEGPTTSETRDAIGFTRVEAGNGIRVTLRIGPETSVEVSAQANILPIIATEVDDGTLRIRSTEGFTTSAGVSVTVLLPTLDTLSLSGGSQGVLEGVDAGQLGVELSGGAVLTASGSATALTLTSSGGSIARLDGMQTETVRADISGGSNATVRASVEVAGSASGGAHLTVLGDATLNVETSGGASVSRG
jgi:hypothetical protein